MVLVLKNEQMEDLVPMAEEIEAIEAAFRELGEEKALNAPRARLRVQAPGKEQGTQYYFNNIMGLVPGIKSMALRIDSSFSREDRVGNSRRRVYPGNFVGMVFLFDMETCELLAIMDDHVPSVLRVAATSGVAMRALARPDAAVLGLLGSGEQARTQVLAALTVRPIRRVKVFSPTRAHREAFARAMAEKTGVDVAAVDSAEEAVRESDIVTAATNTVDPVVEGEWLARGCHVNSIVGGDGYLPRRELDDEAIRRAGLIVVGSRQQIFLDRQAEFAERIERGLVRAEDLHELGELLTGRCRGRRDADEITLFKNNTGMGIQFAATARLIYEKARERGIGTELPSQLFVTERGSRAYSP
ncbi:MAG TPA: ornithine cyclodeaminase family protein [Candidatus Acidoferrales bacterium]|nr:ornithine cyclodeaminase family protein [Candidatus Acidoferrales bacterium]